MKIYRCTYADPHEGNVVSWHPSKVLADAYLKTMQDENRGGETSILDEVVAVDIPTDKKGLIAWLNRNLIRDNG